MYKDGQRHAQPDLQPTCNQLATDCISRQDVIELVKNSFYDLSSSMDDTWAMVADVERLPSVQPVAKDTNVLNNDTISRAEAIDEITEYGSGDAIFMSVEELKRRIELLPSVQPEPHYDEWCTDCKEYDQERHSCPRWNKVIRETLKDAQPEIIRCKDCKFYTPLSRETKSGICNLLIHQNFDDDWYCAGAERRTDEQTDER